MRLFIFTKRDREVLQAELAGILDKKRETIDVLRAQKRETNDSIKHIKEELTIIKEQENPPIDQIEKLKNTMLEQEKVIKEKNNLINEMVKDLMLLAVLKNRIKDYRTNLLKDVNLMKQITVKFKLDGT